MRHPLGAYKWPRLAQIELVRRVSASGRSPSISKLLPVLRIGTAPP